MIDIAKRIIIAGSRGLGFRPVWRAIELEMLTVYPDVSTILCGEARGVDMIGAEWAISRGDLAIEYYPARWEADGRGAGFIRNHRMAMNADGLLAIWDGESRGTEHMIKQALKERLEIRVVYV